MHFILLGAVVLGLLAGPTLWVRWMLWRHDSDRPDLRHTGAGFANTLIQTHELRAVTVATTDRGDHYDPLERTIRLSKRNHDRRSITAAATAFHEFGHALQHARGYEPIVMRTRMAKWIVLGERAASACLIASPAVAFAAPGIARLMLMLGAFGMLLQVPLQLITLPVEFDASFNRALPLLRKTGELPARDLRAARQVLTACAFTYVASALWSLLSIRRWLRILFRR
jgi:Zn-dependent membrane protease YugP